MGDLRDLRRGMERWLGADMTSWPRVELSGGARAVLAVRDACVVADRAERGFEAWPPTFEGIPIRLDEKVPAGELWLRDERTGLVVGKLVNVGGAEARG